MKALSPQDLAGPEREDLRFRRGILSSLVPVFPDTGRVLASFSEAERTLPFSSQEKTGYCWLAAALNCISAFTSRKYAIPPMTFSRNYLVFYDKAEKANWFLEHVLATLFENEDSRALRHLLRCAATDRGQWQMARNLILKYGLVPGEIMTDAAAAHDTGELNTCLGMLLRRDAARLRELHRNRTGPAEVRAEKERMFQEVLSILHACYGSPPERIRRPREIPGSGDAFLTPRAFFETCVGFPFQEYVSLYNDGEDSPMAFCTDRILLDGNVVGGGPNTFLHVPEDVFHAAVLRQVEEEGCCWFGCDSGKFHFQRLHLYDDTAVELARFSPSLREPVPKSWINRCSIAALNHALVLRQTAFADGKRWWLGMDSAAASEGVRGRCLISDHWLRQYGFQAVVKAKYLPDYRASSTCRDRMPWELSGGVGGSGKTPPNENKGGFPHDGTTVLSEAL